MDASEARRLVADRRYWHHKFEIFPGVITPGSYDPMFLLKMLGLPAELSGVRILDVGTSDGFFAMHLARRGAEITAVDYRRKQDHGFGDMERITGLSFEYIQMNIYDIRREDMGGFDIVLFLGVLYHLPDMLRALDILRRICDERMFLETHSENTFCPDVAAARYYEAATLAGDHTNFWAPNRLCLLAMLRDVGFMPRHDEIWGERLFVEAEAGKSSHPSKTQIAYGVL